RAQDDRAAAAMVAADAQDVAVVALVAVARAWLEHAAILYLQRGNPRSRDARNPAQGTGRGSRLPAVRDQRRRPGRGRSPPARLAGAGPVRFDGMDGPARRQALAAAGTGAGH